MVFTQKNGGPINPSNLRNRWFYPLLLKAGLPRVHLHDLRHTAATALLTEAGADIKTVQEILGHASHHTTLQLYVHGRDPKKKAAVSALEKLLTATPEKHDG